jgi:hypothetical protein
MALRLLNAVPARANGVRTPATMATRRPVRRIGMLEAARLGEGVVEGDAGDRGRRLAAQTS